MILLFLAALLLSDHSGRIYHPMTISAMAAQDPGHWKGMRTHVQVEGWTTYRKKEGDGDIHLRLCEQPKTRGMDRKACIVAEIIPAIPVVAPKVGQKVMVRGISRFDGENGHGFWELHPVESLEVLP